MARNTTAITDVLDSETWADRYLLHKYWARKPANVVRQYIEHYTKEIPGAAVVLDPFCGSGVTAVEALALGKNAVVVDVNPIACKITEVTAAGPIDVSALERIYRNIMSDVQAELGWLYATECPECGKDAVIHSVGWEKDTPLEVRYTCAHCGTRRVRARPFGPADAVKIQQISTSEIPYWFPDPPVFIGWQTLKLKRAGLKSFAELYTKRNLWALAALWDRIQKVPEPSLREILQVTFTSVVAQGTKMIADFKDKAGGPSWKINTYWLPSRRQELNVFRFFANRFEKMRKAKLETNRYLWEERPEGKQLRVYNVSATNLTPLESDQPEKAVVSPNSVDYIFTDPPYGGESIQYLELSALWNMWLTGGTVPFADEVIFNPHRDLEQSYYDRMLAKAFRQAYLALKPGRWMSVTFHNKDSEVWNSLLSACTAAGFVMETIVPLNPSAPNLTQKLTRGAPKTDLILNFRKPRTGETRQMTLSEWNFELEPTVLAAADVQIAADGFTTTGRVFDQVMIKWFTAHFGRPDARSNEELTFSVFDVAEILSSHYAAGDHLVDNPQVRERGDTHWVPRPQ